MNTFHRRQHGSALEDLNAMLNLTPNEREKARIMALIGAVQARQEQFGFHLDSSYTPGLAYVLGCENERRQQRSATP